MPAARTVTLPALDNRSFLLEDEANYQLANADGTVPAAQLARPQEVNFSLNNSGTWELLPDGSRIWRLRIVSPNATDTWLIYDQWRIVKPCELYVYNDNQSMVFGPYTSVDNWDGTNVTPIVEGDAVTLEYRVPADQEDIGELSVMRVLHGYRHFHNREARERDALDNFGDSMPCMININCFGYMQEEKRAVAMVIDPMGGACSGTMLNNTLQNGDPLFLTANHCLNGNQNNWLFYFNYESAACSPTTNGSGAFVVANATLLMSHAPSDHALLRLSRPRPETPYIPAYMGWYRPDIAASSSYGIHHPAADVKKGHEDYDPASSTDWNGQGPNTHWLTHIDNGMMEPGSSGSPMINPGGYVVGPLHGGSWDCDPNTVNDAIYGKMATAWEGGGSISTRLRDWLDPNNSGATFKGYWQPVGPPNDSCGQPGSTTITSLPYSTSGSTLFAANNFNTSGCNINTSPDMVYMLQLPCDHQVTVSSCGSSFDTQIFVFGAYSCGSVGWLAGCNDDFCGVQSQVSFTATGGQLYMIVLEGYASSYGNFVLNITGTSSGAQGNAQCPGYAITEVPYFTYGATWCGNDDVNPSCQSNDGQDVHWYWVSPYNQTMRARTCYINFDTILEVRYSGACPGSFSAGCNDDYACAADALASTVVFGATAGITYYIHMDGYAGAEGIASLELGAYNDDCSSPIVVPSLPANYGGDTRAAQDDFATVVGPNSKEVFFQYTSPTCQTVYVHTCDDNLTLYDTGLEVRTGGPCPGTTLVAYNDDACGNNGLKSSLQFNAEANRTYYIIVCGYQTNAGQFMVYFNGGASQGAPVGDVCETALQIPSLPFTDHGNTCCMADNYTPCVGPDSREVVYNYYSTSCQNVTVSLCGSSYDTGLGIYGGTCPNIAPLIACNDDNYCGGTFALQSTATFTAEANTNYQILIHGYQANCGNYVLNVSGVPCPPPLVVAPDSLTIKVDPTTATAELRWSNVPNANTYWVYRSLDENNILDPANLIAGINTNSYNCSGCLNQADTRVFFAVTAEYVPLVTGAEAEAQQASLAGLSKSDAVQGPIWENPHINMTNEIEEQAYKNGK
ncbi:MAG: trypsin-like peptidase domain-containing protein [Calditrichaeota bacterium]|nr:trypsin-like peptidase domain-containing protein [Calditrichota bacterium]